MTGSKPLNLVIMTADENPPQELAAIYVSDGDIPVIPSDLVKAFQEARSKAQDE